MPFRSEKQRRLMWAAHPDIAKRWAHEPGAKNSRKDGLPMRKKKKKLHRKRGVKVKAHRRMGKTIKAHVRKRTRRKGGR
jgi:hypothetical protein